MGRNYTFTFHFFAETNEEKMAGDRSEAALVYSEIGFFFFVTSTGT